jgi:hypothetical protein
MNKGGMLMQIFRSFWWVFLFLLVGWGLYAKGMEKKRTLSLQLKSKIAQLESQRLCALQKGEELRLQIESQSDPAWVEMVLKKKLGVVPEGQIKVYFETE